MDENKDIPSGAEQEQPQVPSKPVVIESKPIKPSVSVLASKLADVKDSSQAGILRLNILFGQRGDEIVQQDVSTIDSVLSVGKLAQIEEITPAEFLQQSHVTLNQTQQAITLIEAEKRELQRSLRDKNVSVKEIEARLEELSSARGLKELFNILEKRRLERQKAISQQEVDALGLQAQPKDEQMVLLREQKEQILKKQQELLLEEVAIEAKSVKDSYEQMLKEILEEGSVTEEIRSLYIEKVVSPEMEEVARERNLSEFEKKEFYTALRNYVSHLDNPEENDFRQIFEATISNYGLFDVGDKCNVIFSKQDEKIIQALILSLARRDVSNVERLVDSQDYTYQIKNIFGDRIRSAIETDRYSGSFGALILNDFNDTKDYPSNMDLWQMVKDSPSANLLFEEIIRKKDKEYYERALEKSCKDRDGSDIDKLKNYPTPDSIRNLVLIAAKLNYRSYEVGHANWALRSLAKRSDWQNLLDEAEIAYPNLKKIRPILKTWEYSEQSNNPEILEQIDDFALGLFESNPTDGELLKLAKESLSTNALITILISKGVLTEQQTTALREVDSGLNQIEQEAEKDSFSDHSYINRFHFAKELRVTLLKLLDYNAFTRAAVRVMTNETAIEISPREVIQRFEVFSKEILENKTNFSVVEYLTSSDVLGRVTDPLLKTENLLIFLRAYKTCPELLLNEFDENKTLFIREFCEQFEGEQTVFFFRDMTITYKNYEQQANKILFLVGNKTLSQERALELPGKAKELFLNQDVFNQVINFPELFLTSDEGIVFFGDITAAYQDHKQSVSSILRLVGNKTLSQERALELPGKAKELFLNQDVFHLAMNFPELFLNTDEGIALCIQIYNKNLFNLDVDLDARFGEMVKKLQKEHKLLLQNLMIKIFQKELKDLDEILTSDSKVEVNDQNWQQMLIAYTRAWADVRDFGNFSQTSIEKIKQLFDDPKVKDLCLNQLKTLWFNYLKSGSLEKPPISLVLMSEFINHCEGVGPLSQLESLSSLIIVTNEVLMDRNTAERTKTEVSSGLVKMEERFEKEKWSNEDRTDFYNVSRDILKAAPSLFTDYFPLFEKLTPSQLRTFVKDIYPLYKTKLIFIEKDRHDFGYAKYDVSKLVDIRKDIRSFTETYSLSDKAFDIQREKLISEIKVFFKDRFGIIKTPQEFNQDHARSITNISMYLGNMKGKTSEKEIILGFYLSLMINDRWDDFRRGEIIDPGEYLVPEKSSVINRLLIRRNGFNPLTPEALGITKEEMPEFSRLLQEETQNIAIGDIETIDVKLTNIILNLQGLEDPDLYPDQLDKSMMQLLLNYGNKKVGSAAAKMHQSLSNPDRAIQFSEEESKVREQIIKIIQELNLNLTPEIVKEHFQDGIRPMSTVVSLLSFIQEKNVGQEIEKLRNMLTPSESIIGIFNRLGEDFKPTSGALALSQDLNYLDNLIVKKEDELTPDEKTILVEYTSLIRKQMVGLEELYEQIKNKFGAVRQGNAGQKNKFLKEKLDQIDGIILSQATQTTVLSTVTNNLNVIIENIRECLACTNEGGNNDTDLTFGDENKFYLYSQTEDQQKGSISDQIVFIEPIVRADGSEEISFVLDRVYGTRSLIVLENQIDVVFKKIKIIKQKFPNIQLSIFVTESAITTGGTSVFRMLETLKLKGISATEEMSIGVDVAESAMGDHYIEFGGDSRSSGKRETKGIIISV
jgi:hypothetical protein